MEKLFENKIFLAPMADVTDFAFRSIAKEFGADVTITEMVSAKALVYGSQKTLELLRVAENESPVGAQLFGHEPKFFEEALASPVFDRFDFVDINMGCPAPKIVKNGDGSALMKNIPLAQEIVRACKRAFKKPVSVKMRLGFDENNAVMFAKAMEEAGADAITVHGRTREMMYSGKADYEAIAEVVRAVKIPVIANGDVVDRESLNEILKTGASSVMVGRGALGRPWIFTELKNKKIKINKLEIIKKHINLLKKYYKNEFLAKYMKKHILWYLKNEKDSTEIKKKISFSKTLEETMDILENYFKNI